MPDEGAENPELEAWLASLAPHHRAHIEVVIGAAPDWWRAQLTGDDALRSRKRLEEDLWKVDVSREIERQLATDTPVSAALRQVILVCERERPHPDWAAFAGLDFDADVRRIDAWFVSVLDESAPPAAVTGMWFGLSNPIRDGEPTADLEVSGGPFDSDDDEWVYAMDWRPSRQARSQVLDSIYRLAYPRGLVTAQSPAGEQAAYNDAAKRMLGNDAEYTLALGYAALAVRQVLSGRAGEQLSSDGVSRIAFAGFNDGDFFTIGKVTPDGLQQVTTGPTE